MMQRQAVEPIKQEAEKRRSNFLEVSNGYDRGQAMEEANRCLQCKHSPCSKMCPVGIDVPGFIKAIAGGDFDSAISVIKERNSLPCVTGRVCPQEMQCQSACIMGKAGDPISIGRLERFVADYEHKKGVEAPELPPSNGKKVAVIGAGPAGLTAAADLAKMGYAVTVFEALHTPGGVLAYGIPEFRLPKRIVKSEVEYVKSLGVVFEMNVLIGKLFQIEEVLGVEGFDSVFIGSGAGLPNFLRLPGENLNGVYSANEFLMRVNMMKAFRHPDFDTPVKRAKKVAVIGGGNVAMDSARCALRLGAEKVYVIYRRSKGDLPARHEEVEHAEEEGIEFLYLTNPIEFLGNEEGCLSQVCLVKMSLGEKDESGRRRPIVINGSEFRLDVDQVIIAVGQRPNKTIPQTTEGLEVTRWGTITADAESLETSLPRVYAGGDVVSGAATVISAMAAGKRAARSMHEKMMG